MSTLLTGFGPVTLYMDQCASFPERHSKAAFNQAVKNMNSLTAKALQLCSGFLCVMLFLLNPFYLVLLMLGFWQEMCHKYLMAWRGVAHGSHSVHRLFKTFNGILRLACS